MTTDHLCHWPGCETKVAPKLWGCKEHWFTLPTSIRSQITNSYRKGQEVDKRPSGSYLEAARAARAWIRNNAPYASEED